MNIKLSNKRVLITGGAGFIGSNLCETILNKGNQVVCLDNFATGKIENLENLLNDTNFTLIEGDIWKLEDCLKASKVKDMMQSDVKLMQKNLYLKKGGYKINEIKD